MKTNSAVKPTAPTRLRHLTLTPSVLAICLALGTMGTAQARPQKLGNMGQGLRELVELHQARTTAGLRSGQGQLRAALAAQASKASMAVVDTRDRVRVDIHMDGTLPLAAFRSSAAWTGLQSLAESSTYRHGVMTAFVPAAQLAAVARLPGVKSVTLSHAPRTNSMMMSPAGSVVSQGVGVMKSDQVNALGYVGRGVTVGALSDSYDADTTALTHAAGDVSTGNLPGAGNAYNSTPVVVVDEVLDPTGVIDEGRAMLQLVHDIAPASKLCFASAFNGEVSFANNILALADPTGSCKANIIVDDVFYYDEPFFSDGIVAQAVDAVAAAGVSYFSSAGNQGTSGGYQSNVRPVSYAAAVASNPTVNLALIGGAAAAPGGFHNFSAVPGVVDIAQTVTVGSNGLLILQWDDVFNASKVTTDFDIYLFNSAGNQVYFGYSGWDNNLPGGGTDQAIEFLYFPGAGTYQLVIARYSAPTDTPAPAATKLRYVNFAGATSGEYLDVNSPVTFGHSAARGAISTAAVPWFQPYQPEYFTSPGPSTIFFDVAGNRLSTPEIRLKPDIAAPDGGNTTFFYGDTSEDSDTLPNFFGTSAAAPAAAGVAALVMEKAGGPTRVRPSQMRQVLQSTAHAHNLQAGYVDATAVVGPVKVTVSATDNVVQSSTDPNTFKVSMVAPAGYTLQSVTIDLSTANAQRVRLGVPSPGLQFDTNATTGYAATKGELKNIAAGDVSFSPLSGSAQQLTLNFAAGKFGGKSSVAFGVDRDEAASGAGGNAVDLLVGGKVTGLLVGPAGSLPFTTTFQPRQFGKGYSVVDGYGLIDALGALNAPLP